MTADLRRVRLKISGRVQGVFFRESTRREAERLGVRGWVRNDDDGTVEALIEGSAAAVDALIQWCHHGPPSAKVEHVQLTDERSGEDLDGFRVTR
jgi:acylphosphatase